MFDEEGTSGDGFLHKCVCGFGLVDEFRGVNSQLSRVQHCPPQQIGQGPSWKLHHDIPIESETDKFPQVSVSWANAPEKRDRLTHE